MQAMGSTFFIVGKRHFIYEGNRSMKRKNNGIINYLYNIKASIICYNFTIEKNEKKYSCPRFGAVVFGGGRRSY